MPVKKLKKVTRKQNGKKLIKGQAAKLKQKHEIEVTLKEQISELDKEILLIKINEAESKLNRKMQLCSYMEGEISTYKTLYNGKLFLKSESMKLLNEAFQDFASEIFLLDQEYESMKSTYSKLAIKQQFCTEYKKNVDKLNTLVAKLEKNLLESEKCHDELPVFMNIFMDLEEKAINEKEKYNSIKEEILINFDKHLLGTQNEISQKTDASINDKELKLNLLPLSWQALFQSGWLGKLWLDSSLKYLQFQQSENSLLRKKWEDLLQSQSSFNIIDGEEKQVLTETKELATSENAVNYSKMHQEYLNLKIQNLNQQKKIKSMKCEIDNLEKAIQSLEISGETFFEKSYLLQIVYKAGTLLKQGFEIL